VVPAEGRLSVPEPLVLSERRGAVALLTLNRPDKLNAINEPMIRSLDAALDAAESDESVRSIVVAGAGRAFSAGFDLGTDTGAARPDPAQVRRTLEDDFRLIMRFWDSPKPTVAAVHGYCLGSSLELALACDVTVAAEDCCFGEPEVKFGSGVVALLLPWLAGPKAAKYLLLTGDDRVSAAEMQAMGLIARVVPAAALLDESIALAGRIASNDAQAVRLTKQAINRSLDIGGMREALVAALETDVVIETNETAESREFNEILKRDGARAAIAWRAGRSA
jgi:enoyl-CoA hydratase